jgi:SAM-dependent methyltransferase
MHMQTARKTRPFDQSKAEGFAYQLMSHLNGAALALMTSIGHRTGLFDALSHLPPATSEEIARAAGLNERYVREWLGAMTVGGIVECDPDGPRYFLPDEHAALLTRAASPDNVAVTAQYIAELGSVEGMIVDRFKNGGGLRYEDFGRFHEVMAEDSAQTVIAALMDQILPLVDGLKEALERGIDVLDVGCGSGFALIFLARHFPNSRFVGYDLSAEAIERGRRAATLEGVDNVTLEIRDLSEFPGDRTYDLITAFDAIHDQARPDNVLRGIHDSLKPDGVFLMQDVAGSSHHHKNMDHPIGPLVYAVSTLHCMPVSLGQNGMGLGAAWGEEKAQEMLRDAGFGTVAVKKLDHDFFNAYFIVRK